MKTLYESIIGNTNIGKNYYIREIVKNPNGKENELNKIWETYGLHLNFGFGIGNWEVSSLSANRIIYNVPVRTENDTFYITFMAYIGHGYASDIVVDYQQKNNFVKKPAIKKWAEKICSAFNMNMHIEKNYIYLNFL